MTNLKLIRWWFRKLAGYSCKPCAKKWNRPMNQRQLHLILIINFRWNGKFVQMDLIFSCDGFGWLMLMVYCIIYFVMYIIVFIAVGSCNSRSYFRLPYLCYRRWTWPTSTSNGIHWRYPISTRMWKDRFSGINVVSGVCVCQCFIVCYSYLFYWVT